MAENKKSIISEALLDAKRIQEALNSNAKEILRSVAIEEIDSLVRESLNEDEYEEEDVEDDSLDLADDGEDGEEIALDTVDGEEEEEAEDDMEDDNEYNLDDAGMDDMEGGEEMSYDGGESDDDYSMDMTGASDDDVIAVYKKLSGDDEIEVVSDTEVHITDPESGAEYQVKLGGAGGAVETDALGVDGDDGVGMEDYFGASDESMADEDEEETVYEIALDDEGEELTEESNGKVRTATSDVTMGNDSSAPNTGDIEGQKAPLDNDTSGDNLVGGFDDDGENGSGDNHGDHIMEDDEINEDDISEEDEVDGDEVDETKYVGGKVKRVATAHTNKKLENESVSESARKYKALVVETNKLKKQNEEFRTALKKFRQMLGETVVFNTNLTNVTRIFTEHSTTREEKEQIIARFDEEATTIKESKRLYKSIVSGLASKAPISESVENKISKEVSTSQSGGAMLNESTAYVDASTQRIKDLITRVERPR